MIGESLLHYRILDTLGVGGMGEVFLAEDTRLRRRVALKLLPPELVADETRLARLEREARSLARLAHPGVVVIHAIEEDRGRRFLVMELVEGERLDRLIPRHGMDFGRILEIAVPIADALAAAHEEGVVHRDLKPTNVMVSHKGAVKVLDFGLAWTSPESVDPMESTHSLTETGALLGTLPYMAPEQVRGCPPDARGDLFAFGVMLFEMATGKRPFQGHSAAELASAILLAAPPPVDSVRPELPHDLGRIVHHCLQKDPERRYQTAKGLRNELLELTEEVRTGAVVAQPQPALRSIGPMALLGAALLVFIGLAVALGAGWLPFDRPSPVQKPETRALLTHADQYEERGDSPAELEQAEKLLRRALALEPANAYLKARLAALLARVQQQYPASGRQEEIQRLVDAALAADEGLAPAWIARGRLALMQSDWKAAERAARRARREDPDEHETYALLGEALVAQGRADEAIAEASKALGRKGPEVWGRLALARVLLKAGRLNEAVVQYEKVLEFAPDSPNALSNLGVIYAKTGREIAAVPLFRRLMSLRADDTAASNLGYALFNLGRFEEAVEAIQEAHRLKPDHPGHERNLADAYEALGDEEAMRDWLTRALADYDRALGAGGPQVQLLAERAVAAAKLGRAEEARGNIASALEQQPEAPLFEAAEVEALLGDVEAMLGFIERSLAAGHPRETFLDDPIFAPYWDHERFRELLFEQGR